MNYSISMRNDKKSPPSATGGLKLEGFLEGALPDVI